MSYFYDREKKQLVFHDDKTGRAYPLEGVEFVNTDTPEMAEQRSQLREVISASGDKRGGGAQKKTRKGGMSESQKDIILKMLNEGAKPDAIAKEAESSVPMVYYMKAKFKKEGKLNYENR